MIYVIGSLRNPRIPEVGIALRAAGFDAFDEWYAAGSEADERWQEYERQRGRPYHEALYGAHAQNVFDFDRRHLTLADAAVLVAPAGKSAHLELGWALGQGKWGYILMEEEPERYDVMARFADGVFRTVEDLIVALKEGPYG